MKRKRITITQKSWAGLKYVEVHGVPAERDAEYGDLVHAETLGKMERRIAEEILSQQRPIYGQEVVFLRKALGMSRREFARGIGLTDVAILKWERATGKRLASMNEIVVRVYFAKKLGLSLDEVMSPLIPEAKSGGRLRVEFDSGNQTKSAA